MSGPSRRVITLTFHSKYCCDCANDKIKAFIAFAGEIRLKGERGAYLPPADGLPAFKIVLAAVKMRAAL
jgi:hypothetical protein